MIATTLNELALFSFKKVLNTDLLHHGFSSLLSNCPILVLSLLSLPLLLQGHSAKCLNVRLDDC